MIGKQDNNFPYVQQLGGIYKDKKRKTQRNAKIKEQAGWQQRACKQGSFGGQPPYGSGADA